MSPSKSSKKPPAAGKPVMKVKYGQPGNKVPRAAKPKEQQ